MLPDDELQRSRQHTANIVAMNAFVQQVSRINIAYCSMDYNYSTVMRLFVDSVGCVQKSL